MLKYCHFDSNVAMTTMKLNVEKGKKFAYHILLIKFHVVITVVVFWHWC